MIQFQVLFDGGKCLGLTMEATATIADVKAKLLELDAAEADAPADGESKQPAGGEERKEGALEGQLHLDGKQLADTLTLEEAGVKQETSLTFKWSGGIKLSAQCEWSAVAHTESKEDFTVMVSMKAPRVMDVQRVPVDLCLVVDRSGSMSSLMELVIETIVFMVQQLQPTDRLSIVEYDNQVTTLLGLTSMDQAGKERAKAAAQTLTPRGGTDLASGLFRGMQLLHNRSGASNEVSSVLLFTDGQANVGHSDAHTIVSLMQDSQFIAGFDAGNVSRVDNVFIQQTRTPMRRSVPVRQARANRAQSLVSSVGSGLQSMKRKLSLSSAISAPEQQPKKEKKAKKKAPAVTETDTDSASTTSATSTSTSGTTASYTVNTFGFGSNHNSDLLKSIAEAGNGLYFFIENRDQIGDAFVDCVGGLLSVVGQKLHLELAAGEGAEIVDVLTSYPKARQGAGRMTVDIRDIQSEESRDLICRVRLHALPAPTAAQTVLSARLSYDNCISHQADSASCAATLARPDPTDEALAKAMANLSVDEQRNRVLAAEALSRGTKLGDRGQLKEARDVLSTAMGQLRASPTKDRESTVALVKGLESALGNMQEMRTWESKGSKVLANMSHMHYQQRSSPMSEMQGAKYSNMKKAKMKSSLARFKNHS